MSIWNSLVVSLWCGKYEFDCEDNIKTYKTFGNHDSISIAPISGDTSTEILAGMWEKTNYFSHNIKAGESIHNLFAISDDDNCEQFWKNDTPYLFMSSIQINYNSGEDFNKQYESFFKEVSSILEESEFIKNRDFAIYNSLDSGDVILFLKTNIYVVGADIINKITMKSKYNHYSYSVCGLNTNLLLKGLESNQEIIPKVVICSVLADVSKYQKWFENFNREYPFELNSNFAIKDNNDFINEEYVHLARLGNEDICINIYNCNMKHFLNMFLKEDGVFYYNNYHVKNVFARLRIQFDSNVVDMNFDSDKSYKNGKSLIEKSSDQWKYELTNTVSAYISKAIFEVLAASENLELKKFAFDVQDCIRNVFPLFTSKLHSYYKNDFAYSQKKFEHDVILFTTGLLSIANGSLHADKLFINVPGFNAVPCDIPSKLLIYYTAYIQRLTTILNDREDFDYRFLLCPDLYLGIEIFPLFYYNNSDSQLLKARIPIKKLFEPKILLMELSHEVAHYVGSSVRARKERADLLIEMISYIFADRILRPKTLIPVFQEDDGFANKDIESKIISLFMPSNNKSLELLLENEWNPIIIYIKNNLINESDINEKDILYLNILKEKITKSATNLMIGEKSKELQNKIYDVIQCNNMLEDPDKIFGFVNMIERHKTEILFDEYVDIVKNCCTLFSESFADLVMLYITNDPNSYLYNIFKSENRESFKSDDNIIHPWEYHQAGHMKFERIISVFTSLGYNFDDINKKNNPLFEKYIENLKNYSLQKNELNRAVPITVINIITEYLNICLKELENKKSDFEVIKALYDTTEKRNVNIFINEFRKIAFEFRTQLINQNEL